MTLIAILLPWLSFFLRGRILTGILCLILQITVIGWIPAAIWAVISLSEARANRRNRRIVRAIEAGGRRGGRMVN
ncbi:MAG: YqaE/Pmp3 family membrane protein [Chitinophagaceae bacterium]